MIRRDRIESSGERFWILISQVEHAHLAGTLAEHWSDPGGLPAPREEFLAAIYHHDDGWTGWIDRPEIDVRSGRPLSFTEMPLHESLDIWRASIDRCAAIGPLAGYMVAGHFSALLRKAGAAHQDDADWQQTASQYLAQQDRRQEDWIRQWQGEAPETRTRASAQRALAYLQLFDALSLWLCCADRTDDEQFETPEQGMLRLSPGDNSRATLSPWPLRSPSCTVNARGQVVPAARYAGCEELLAAVTGEVTLTWDLTPTPIPG